MDETPPGFLFPDLSDRVRFAEGIPQAQRFDVVPLSQCERGSFTPPANRAVAASAAARHRVRAAGYEPGRLASGRKAALDIVRKTFEGRDWVQQIVDIPSTYLTPHGGFDNLDQIARMYGVDDRAGFGRSDSVRANQNQLAYLSIVGPYLLPLEKNENAYAGSTSRFPRADAHVPPACTGLKHRQGHTTTVDEPKTLRSGAANGLRSPPSISRRI
jgi:rhombotail lipoprotein